MTFQDCQTYQIPLGECVKGVMQDGYASLPWNFGYIVLAVIGAIGVLTLVFGTIFATVEARKERRRPR